MPRLTGIILTYNEAEHIQACIESLQFADEVMVFDSFSTDETVGLAQAAGARVLQRIFDHYAGQRNAALAAVRETADWVLFVDADERVTPELAAEVQRVIQNPGHCAGYRIPRLNYLFGKLTKGAGWYPDYQTRLLKVGAAQYDPARQVHEVTVLQGEEGTLQAHFIHYNYKNMAQFIHKQQKYVAYDARILQEQGIRPKPWTYFTQPLRHFYWRFITLKGYADGWHGFRLSSIMAWYEFKKYVLLRGLLRQTK